MNLLFLMSIRLQSPGILLFTIVLLYWTLPRAMDEALTLMPGELFKFFSLPFLAGIPLRNSWSKLKTVWRNTTIIHFTIVFVVWGWVYIQSPTALCNNYLQTRSSSDGGFLSRHFVWFFFLSTRCLLILVNTKTFHSDRGLE